MIRPKTASVHSRGSQFRESIETAPLSAQRAKSPGEGVECPLDDPELGVVSNNDHLTRKCLCQFCTCGRHKCPGIPYLDPYPTSMYSTQYKSRFQQGTSSKPIRPVLPYHRHNIHNMEFLTQYEKDYRPFRVEVPEEMYRTTSLQQLSRPHTAGTGGRRSGLSATGPVGGFLQGGVVQRASIAPGQEMGAVGVGPQARFMGLSSYNIEYPDWGGSKPYHMRRIHEAVPTKDMKFEGQSRYRENFMPAESLTGLSAKPCGQNTHSSLTLHGATVKLDGKTTAQETFKPFPKGTEKTPSFKKYERILSAQILPGMYTTEYKEKYIKQKRLLKNPQDVRKQLSAQAH